MCPKQRYSKSILITGSGRPTVIGKLKVVEPHDSLFKIIEIDPNPSCVLDFGVNFIHPKW